MSERKGHSTFKRQLDMLDGKNIFANTEWTDWLRDRRSKIYGTSLTIMEHKKLFLNKRPDWAKTFSEKKTSIYILENNTDKYFMHLLQLSSEEWSIERELVDEDEDTKYIVERILNASGDCRCVTTMYPDKENGHIYRRESWVFKGRWLVSQKLLLNSKGGFFTDTELLRSTEMWLKIFK